MYPAVTAIVVARNGAAHLQRTLDALAVQTRPIDSLAVIDVASKDATSEILAVAGATHLLSTTERLSFGDAVTAVARVLPQTSSEDEWLWLLADDTAPEPDVLERMLATVEVSPSVAIAGPKLVDWDDAELIRDLGVSMTPLGASAPYVEDELDQGQHDHVSDVLGVPSGAMLVRATVWDALGGFDPALPVIDDGLDLCVRARLAGHRIVLVPSARVASAGRGVAGPQRYPKGSERRRLFRLRRTAQLHRRMAYAPGIALAFHWISLVPLAIVRALGWLLGKQPGAIAGELSAAFATAFGRTGVSRARTSIARTKRLGWGSIAPLRVPYAEVRRARSLKREASLVRIRGERTELNFFSGGGAWVVLATALMSIALFAPLLGAKTVTGGGLLPLSSGVGQLWSNLGYGWRDIGIGFVGAADPFSAVLAVLGSLTFWQPSYSIVLLWLAALPLATLGAWFLATRITHRAVLRALFALAWAVAPMLFDALQNGRPAAVVVHILLPWLFFAAFAARRSLAASAATALLAAAVAACSPSLIPALAIIWIIWVVSSGRRIARVIAVPLPAIVLFAPLAWQQIARGSWISIFADPGLPTSGSRTHAWQLALGFPDGSLGGWQSLAAATGMPGTVPTIVVPILMLPLAILALLAVFVRGTGRAILSLVVSFLGFCTAVACVQLELATTGDTAVPIWSGSALSLYWLGLIAAATMALVALGRFAMAPAIVMIVTMVVAIAPLAVALPLATSKVTAGDALSLPAYVTAQAQQDPRTGTLRLTPQSDGGLAAQLVHGMGDTLDQQSTLSNTETSLAPDQRALATLAGNLSSESGLDARAGLKRFGVSFVLLQTAKNDGGQASLPATTERRASVALDSNSLLVQVGSTDDGTLWSVPSQKTSVGTPADAGGWQRVVVFIVFGLVFGVTLLLSIPTGRGERGSLRRLTATELAAGRLAPGSSEPEPGAEQEPEQEQEQEAEGEPDDEVEPAADTDPEDEMEAEAVAEAGSDPEAEEDSEPQEDSSEPTGAGAPEEESDAEPVEAPSAGTERTEPTRGE